MQIMANTSRDFCPSDSSPMGVVCSRPEIPNFPRNPRHSSIGFLSFSNVLRKKSMGWLPGSRTSTECWWYRPIDRCEWRLTVPRLGSTSPVMSLRRVDLPAPLGPTSATRLSQSTPNSRFLSRNPASGSAPGYAKDTSTNGSTGGGSLRHSGNVNSNVRSALGDAVSPAVSILFRIFCFELACFIMLAYVPQLAMKSRRCLISACSLSNFFCWITSSASSVFW
mmetsp:Transcript_30406/g.76078  ORF Transcript_30406/g.76078 Transcript_30406/m.76078 type:complete len:223 (-) Transcript_30406:789-1457(-)